MIFPVPDATESAKWTLSDQTPGAYIPGVCASKIQPFAFGVVLGVYDAEFDGEPGTN
jgi:hypothetical protein